MPSRDVQTPKKLSTTSGLNNKWTYLYNLKLKTELEVGSRRSSAKLGLSVPMPSLLCSGRAAAVALTSPGLHPLLQVDGASSPGEISEEAVVEGIPNI